MSLMEKKIAVILASSFSSSSFPFLFLNKKNSDLLGVGRQSLAGGNNNASNNFSPGTLIYNQSELDSAFESNSTIVNLKFHS